MFDLFCPLAQPAHANILESLVEPLAWLSGLRWKLILLDDLAVFVFHDPRNWALDTQITCDILRNNGYVLPPSVLESTSRTLKGGQADPVSLVFCNPDLLWGNDYPTPRLGQGGFRVAFQSVYRELTGNEYPYTQLGKPTVETYEYAEELLRARLKELYQHYKNEGSQDEILPNV